MPPMSSTRSKEFAVATIDHVIRFGPFCLRPAQQLLLDTDAPVRIGARALDLLIALVERAGELVTKDDLTARVWPGLSVDEGNLRTQMALLRRALRDGEAGARYLITVPGRGYRFVAPVSTTETQERGEQQTLPVKPAAGLPGRLTRLIGRADAISDIAGRLSRRRFVTITGPGGIGKTSVALAVAEQVARSYEDGVCLVDCAPLLDTQLVAGKLASALGLAIAAVDPTEGLVAFLRSRRMLILLDSCERIVEAAAVLAEAVLRGAAGVDILATSREPLRAEGEGVYRLPPLEVPPASGELSASDVLSYPAVQLFVERATSNTDRFELRDADTSVAVEICRKLDGMPLAIELAAGRVDVFGMRGVAARLDDRVRLLTHGRRTALLRHRTLAATLDWSYDALLEPEQTVLRRLAIFAGNFTLDAAQAVATDAAEALPDIADVATSLVSKSLLNADLGTDTGLYRLLDTTREYARKKLVESEEFDLTARRHANYVRLLLGGGTASVVEAAHIDDIRIALDWAFSSTGDVAIGIALTAASLPLWTRLSLNEECRRSVERALLEGDKSNIRNDHREMQLLAALGAALIYTLGPGQEVDAAWADALKIAEKLDDADYQIRILWGMWSSHFNSGQFKMALTIGERFREAAVNSGDTAAELVGERLLGVSRFYLGDHISARHHIESVLQRYVRPQDQSHIVRFQFDQRIVARTVLARLLWAQGFADQAMREVEGAVGEATSIGHAMSLALTLAQAACPVALLCGDFDAAERFIGLLIRHSAEHALDIWHTWGRCFVATLLIERGRTEEGLAVLRKALDGLPQGAFYMRYTGFQGTLAEALGKVGAVSDGLSTIDEALARSDRDDERWYVAECLRIKGELLRLRSPPRSTQEAEEHFERSLDWSRRQQTLSWELRTSISLARLRQDQGRIGDARDALALVSRFKEGLQTADLRAARTLLEQWS
jgi:predicted ATPase/DNA-binding winged helix-turn-helix (wHTH) protein